MEMTARGFSFSASRPFAVTYSGAIVGHHRPDFIVENAVVVELKAVHAIRTGVHDAGVDLLETHGLRVGLLINFNVDALGFGIKRIVK